MIKKFYFTLALFMGIILAATAQTVSMSKSTTSIAKAVGIAEGFGYGDRHATELLGIGNGKATILTAFNKVENIKGATLKYIDAVLAACYTDENGAVVVLDKDMKVVYIEKKTIEMRLNHLELSTPYQFESNDPYYIGYLIHSTSQAAYPLGFDKKECIREGSYIGIHAAMPEQGSSLNEDIFNTIDRKKNFGTLMIFAGIENAPFLENMGYLLELDGVFNTTANQMVNAVARIRNIGMKNITSEELDVMVGTDLQKANKEVLIEQGKTFELPFTVSMPADGTGTVTLKLTKINGVDNPYADIPATKTYMILAENGPFPRETVLIEHFTTEKCSNCPAAEPTFQSYIDAFTKAGLKVSVIEHHAGFQTDAFTIKESEDILDYLGVNFAPAAALDRIQLGDNGECAFFPRIDYTEDFRKMLKDRLEYGRVEKIEQSFADGKVTVKVSGSLVNGFDDDLYVTAVVTEDNLAAINQAGAKGDFVHHDVARMFLSSACGDKATVNGKQFEITFPAKAYEGTWKQENMKIVVLGHRVLDTTTQTDYAQHNVLFSSNVAWNMATGIDEINNEQAPAVTVRDGYLHVNGHVGTVEIYNMDGSFVTNSLAQRLQQGIYIVKTETTNGKHTSKIVVR